jgi:hypothetical protein
MVWDKMKRPFRRPPKYAMPVVVPITVHEGNHVWVQYRQFELFALQKGVVWNKAYERYVVREVLLSTIPHLAKCRGQPTYLVRDSEVHLLWGTWGNSGRVPDDWGEPMIDLDQLRDAWIPQASDIRDVVYSETLRTLFVAWIKSLPPSL